MVTIFEFFEDFLILTWLKCLRTFGLLNWLLWFIRITKVIWELREHLSALGGAVGVPSEFPLRSLYHCHAHSTRWFFSPTARTCILAGHHPTLSFARVPEQERALHQIKTLALVSPIRPSSMSSGHKLHKKGSRSCHLPATLAFVLLPS